VGGRVGEWVSGRSKIMVRTWGLEMEGDGGAAVAMGGAFAVDEGRNWAVAAGAVVNRRVEG